MTGRPRVLMGAYACEPGKGSEPGVGWNMAVHMARFCDVWVLTRANNRGAIEKFLQTTPVPGLQVEYHDLPGWVQRLKGGGRRIRLYYYLWQLAAIPRVRDLHRVWNFDLVHHVTFAKYWAPSALAFAGRVPFLWGPVGGGESVPPGLWGSLSLQGIMQEGGRHVVRLLSEWDPLVRMTARRASRGLASTVQTAARMRALGVTRTEVFNQVGLPVEDCCRMHADTVAHVGPPFFLSVGNLLPVKGLALGLRAFAESGITAAEYWIVGDGPEEEALRRLARQLGLDGRVRFLGTLDRAQVLVLMRQAVALVHPSLHDSGGYVCAEALAAGLPVCALDWGGAGELVPSRCGCLVPPTDQRRTVAALAAGLRDLAKGKRPSPDALASAAARLCWETRAEHLFAVYQHCMASPRTV